MKKLHKNRRHTHQASLFVALGAVMLVAGFGLMLSAALGGRLDSTSSLPLPIGFTTAAIGAMVLTRTPLGVFFLFIYAVAMLVLTITGPGWLSVPFFIGVFLLALCLPLLKRAKP